MEQNLNLDDQIRGVAMALRHWFEIRDIEREQQRLGLLPSGPKDKKYDKRLRPLTVTALPPQLVHLKSDAPMLTLHYMQDIYDDGEFRGDAWRWWLAWIAIELVARGGPDRDGAKTRRFVVEDPSIETVRLNAARWLAANPLRLGLVQKRLRTLIRHAMTAADSPGQTIEERTLRSVENLDRTLVDAMAEEAARIAAAITFRLEERARRG